MFLAFLYFSICCDVDEADEAGVIGVGGVSWILGYISNSSIHLAFAHRRVGFADCRGAPLRQDALGRRGEVERRPVGLGAVVKRLQCPSPIVEPGCCCPLVFIVIAEHAASAAVPDDPERLWKPEEAVEGVGATTEDQVLLEEGRRIFVNLWSRDRRRPFSDKRSIPPA